MKCTLCQEEEIDRKDFTHLNLYVVGSEGITVCLSCRIALTEYARNLKSVASRSFQQGYKRGKFRRET